MLFLILFQTISSKSTCPLFTCSPSYLYLAQSTCIYYDPSRFTPAYFIQPCQDPSLPHCSFTPNQNSTCTASPKTSTLKYPGEKCKQSSDCQSNQCSNQACKGKSLQKPCSSTSDCNPGLYCKTSKCTEQKPLGSSCSLDIECESNTACHLSICTKYLSLDAGQSIKECNEYGENFLCATGKCEENKCSAVKKNEKILKLCSSDKDCPSVCECGINRNANSFCRMEGGDQPYDEYLALVKEMIGSGRMELCNAERQFSFECAADRWDLGKALRMKEIGYYVHNHAKIVEFDDCAREIFIPDYFIDELITIDFSTNIFIISTFLAI